ncbi:MAG: hypothetical protein ACOCUU_01160 [Nanoarchaeota archaeon]
MQKNTKSRTIFRIILILSLITSLILVAGPSSATISEEYNSGWQNFRSNTGYVVCGDKYPSCNLNTLGLDWYSPNSGDIYHIICGETSFGTDCLLWDQGGMGKIFNVPENNDYFLFLGIVYGLNSKGNDEEMIGGYDWAWNGQTAQPITDLGQGNKECVMRYPFPVTTKEIHNKVWLKGIGGSVNPYKFKLSTCISQEDVDNGLVYCDNGQPAVANCADDCEPDIQNTSWSDWEDLNCYENQRNQSRYRVEYDANDCGFQNVTYREYRLVNDSECETCEPDIQINWDNWENLDCFNNTHRQEYRSGIEFDANNCGTFSNESVEEYRFVEDSACEVPECSIDSDCGENFNSSEYCYEGNSYINSTVYSCNQGTCENSTSRILIEECDFGCSEGECENGPKVPEVNITFPKNGGIYNYNVTSADVDLEFSESSDTCWFNLNNGSNKTFPCVNGSTSFGIASKEGFNELQVWTNDTYGNFSYDEVNYIINISDEPGDECSTDSDCPADNYSDNYCVGDDVYRDFHDFFCSDGSCSKNVTSELVEKCQEGCSQGSCIGEDDEDNGNGGHGHKTIILGNQTQEEGITFGQRDTSGNVTYIELGKLSMADENGDVNWSNVLWWLMLILLLILIVVAIVLIFRNL